MSVIGQDRTSEGRLRFRARPDGTVHVTFEKGKGMANETLKICTPDEVRELAENVLVWLDQEEVEGRGPVVEHTAFTVTKACLASLKELRNRARNTDGHFSFYSIGVNRAIDHAQLWLKARRNIEP